MNIEIIYYKKCGENMVYGKGINDMPWGWASENEWNKKIYREWCDMLRRCYDENYQKRNPTYIGCTVCKRWLTLSNFVEDVELISGFDKEKILNGELHLDKDKKNDTDNKGYYLEFCTWLSAFENISLVGLQNKGKNHPMYGKFGSENPTSKKIAQYDKTTNELIKIWGSMMDVERELGISNKNISACCKGKRKSAGGFVWKYEED